MALHASEHLPAAPAYFSPHEESGAFLKVVALFLGTAPRARRRHRASPASHRRTRTRSPWRTAPTRLDVRERRPGPVIHARQMTPDWVTWNGYAGQYVKHPLTAMPGQTVRFWVLDAGPSPNVDFRVVGTLLNRPWVDGDLAQYQRDVQTAVVPAGGGGVFDVKIDSPGLHPFVSHPFASVNLGLVGLLNVGHVQGTMSH